MIRCCWVQVATHTQPLSHTATKKTVAEVQTLLSGQGATAVMVAYNKGDSVALKFKIVIDGNEPGYGMPVDWRAVLQVMRHDRLAR